MNPFPSNNDIKIGMKVRIETRENRDSGKLVEGFVKEKLTSAESHPHGILVLLDSGIKGRVHELVGNAVIKNVQKIFDGFEDLSTIVIPTMEDTNNEFKETFRFDTKEDKLRREGKIDIADKIQQEIKQTDAIRMEIPITVSAFGNANGGKLFLGITKEGEVVGLERDMKKYAIKDNDEFGRKIIEYLRIVLKDDAYISLKIKMVFSQVNEKWIVILQALSAMEPLYVHDGEKQEAYIRQPSAESKKIPMKDFLNYCKNRFA